MVDVIILQIIGAAMVSSRRNDQRVDPVWPRKIAANDELLATIHAILDPGAASFSRLVVAVLLLPDGSFKPLLADRGSRSFGAAST